MSSSTATPAGVPPQDGSGSGVESAQDWVHRLLELARVRLGMELSWVSRIVEDKAVVEAVSGAVDGLPITSGFTSPLGDSYTVRLRGGSAPPVITSPAHDPVARDLPVGAYVGVPLQRPTGEVYGTLSCINRDPDPGVRLRDAQFLHLLADLMTELLDRGDSRQDRRRLDEETRSQVRAVIDQGGPAIVLQSIHALPNLRIIGYEALARFDDGEAPDAWFARARDAGMGIDLELAALTNALTYMDCLGPDQFMGVNISPDAVLHPGLAAALADAPLGQLVLEITEHEKVHDFEGLRTTMDHWRRRGVCFAVDDAGAGYSGMRQLIELRPELIKLDRSITRGLDVDPARFAMATALAAFAREIGSGLVAEGVETVDELAKAQELQIPLAQGYHLGPPAPPPRTRARGPVRAPSLTT